MYRSLSSSKNPEKLLLNVEAFNKGFKYDNCHMTSFKAVNEYYNLLQDFAIEAYTGEMQVSIDENKRVVVLKDEANEIEATVRFVREPGQTGS